VVDISDKLITLRSAIAEGKLFCSSATIDRVKNHDLPKGDLFNVARAAAYLAAKNTDRLIPHCHPVRLDALDFQHAIEADGIRVTVSAKSLDRTGIEMEVLTAVSVALLTIYDMLKPIDARMEITGIRLLEKKGGKSDDLAGAKKLSVRVVVVSDRVASGKTEDKVMEALTGVLATQMLECHDCCVVPDEAEKIAAELQRARQERIDLLLFAGGTGVGPRDITPETIRPLLDVLLPGAEESMRRYGSERNPMAMLSRSLCGFAGDTLVLCLPGSPVGAAESLRAVISTLRHAIDIRRGGAH
jgi:molybdenum cofactor biosynthesis protein MoaC